MTGSSVAISIGVKHTPATRPVAGAFGDHVFVIDQSRCIGCRACVQACEECGTHRGISMIHLDEVDRSVTTQTVPMVCMHCEDPTCAEVCPADAIKQNEDGVVQSSLKPRCIGCSNCVLACPFGVPKYVGAFDQMMKCDMCTSGKSSRRSRRKLHPGTVGPLSGDRRPPQTGPKAAERA
jgi:Fe-S-cluster-containing dehydrogenase component